MRIRSMALLLAVAALAACGKKPDFPVAPSGDVAPRVYPNPALDPQPARPATPAPKPAATPAPSPAIGVEDVRKPVDTPPSNPGAPAGAAIPPATPSGASRP